MVVRPMSTSRETTEYARAYLFSCDGHSSRVIEEMSSEAIASWALSSFRGRKALAGNNERVSCHKAVTFYQKIETQAQVEMS